MNSRFYRWRQLTDPQRQDVLAYRRKNRLPWHSPPHYEDESGRYLITAACFEHAPIIGASVERMADFEHRLVETLQAKCEEVYAWVVLPNHYHALVHAGSAKALLKELGLLHGRTSFEWNGQEQRRGRTVWFNATETAMKSERHFWASLNYVLNNAVRHGYVERWQDWPFSNAAEYLDEVGHKEALRRWNAYPVLDFGAGWDPPKL